MEIGVGRGSVPFMKQEDGARPDPAHDALRDGIRITAHRVESAHRPPNQPQVTPGERRMNEEVFHPGGRTKIARLDAALIDFLLDPGSWETPKRRAGMPGGVVRDLVTGDADRFQFRSESRRAFADYEKRRSCFEAAQNFQEAGCVYWVRPVVDREPDFALGGLEMGHDPAPPLAVCHQGWEENQHVGGEKDSERKERPKHDQGEKNERREQGEAKDQPPARLRVHAGI